VATLVDEAYLGICECVEVLMPAGIRGCRVDPPFSIVFLPPVIGRDLVRSSSTFHPGVHDVPAMTPGSVRVQVLLFPSRDVPDKLCMPSYANTNKINAASPPFSISLLYTYLASNCLPVILFFHLCDHVIQ